MRRHLLGLVAVLLLVVGVTLYFTAPGSGTAQAMIGGMVRVGTVLIAFWLAYPQLSRVPNWFYQCLLVAAICVAIRPRMALIAIPLLAVVWMLKPRKKKLAVYKDKS